jgi:hypothetical protein
MPVEITVETANRLVVFRVTGNPDIREMVASVDRALADPLYQSGYNFLSDRRMVDAPPGPDIVDAAVRFLESNQERLNVRRWAFVVSDLENYRIGRKASILAEPIPTEVEIFTNLDEARRWIARAEAPDAASSPAAK